MHICNVLQYLFLSHHWLVVTLQSLHGLINRNFSFAAISYMQYTGSFESPAIYTVELVCGCKIVAVFESCILCEAGAHV